MPRAEHGAVIRKKRNGTDRRSAARGQAKFFSKMAGRLCRARHRDLSGAEPLAQRPGDTRDLFALRSLGSVSPLCPTCAPVKANGAARKAHERGKRCAGGLLAIGTVAETCIERLALHLVSDLAAETSPGVALPALAQFHAPLQASDPASRSADFRRYPRKLTACTPRHLLLHPD